MLDDFHLGRTAEKSFEMLFPVDVQLELSRLVAFFQFSDESCFGFQTFLYVVFILDYYEDSVVRAALFDSYKIAEHQPVINFKSSFLPCTVGRIHDLIYFQQKFIAKDYVFQRCPHNMNILFLF